MVGGHSSTMTKRLTPMLGQAPIEVLSGSFRFFQNAIRAVPGFFERCKTWSGKKARSEKLGQTKTECYETRFGFSKARPKKGTQEKRGPRFFRMRRAASRGFENRPGVVLGPGEARGESARWEIGLVDL